MNYRERGSKAQYTQDTSRMGTNSNGEARGRSRHKNNARVVRNLEERNVGMKGKDSNKT